MRCGCSALSHITHFRRVCAHARIQTPMLPKSTQKRHKLASAFLSSSLISPQSGGWSGPQDSMVSTRATRATRKVAATTGRFMRSTSYLAVVAPVPGQQPHRPLHGEGLSGIPVATLLPLAPATSACPPSCLTAQMESEEPLSPQ